MIVVLFLIILQNFAFANSTVAATTSFDPHAGHNHSIWSPLETTVATTMFDPHAGHNHSIWIPPNITNASDETSVIASESTTKTTQQFNISKTPETMQQFNISTMRDISGGERLLFVWQLSMMFVVTFASL